MSLAADRERRGFTLLEVMVALAIALPALILLYRQGAMALHMTRTSFVYQDAVSRAQSHLAALVDRNLAPGDRDGDDGGGYRWRARIVPIATALPHDVQPRSAYARGTTLYAVSVQVSWSSLRGKRAVTLETRRLGPAVGDSP